MMSGEAELGVQVEVLGIGHDPRILRDVAFRAQSQQEAEINLVLTYKEQPVDDFSELLGFLGFLDLLDFFF